jgi:hypothetical protein
MWAGSCIQHYARNSGEVGEVRPPLFSCLETNAWIVLYRGILTPLNFPNLPCFTAVSPCISLICYMFCV